MSDDIEAQEYNYNVHDEFLDSLISRNREIGSIESLKKCNGVDDIIQPLNKLVHDLINSKVENLPCYGSLIKLKELIKLEDEKLISEFFDYCAKLCIEEEKLELMCVVTILLQDFINIPLYKSPVSRFIKRLTYVKVPSKWCEKDEFKSINENLHGYKAHDYHNLKPSIIDSLTDETRTKFHDLTQYFKSLNAYWSAFLSDYGSWPRDDPFVSIIMVAYSLFTTIIILNLMIALINNIYSEVLNRAYTEWSMVRAQFIVFTELVLMTPSERQNKDYFPWTIIYEVFTEEVERWYKKLEEDNVSISRNKIQLLNEMADKMKNEITEMEDVDVIKTTMIAKLNELKQLLSKK
ncbi:hypothetical protein C1646_761819 [Rhizophagus diaphanus]|nr:hypothetical protein C1646_761819 [Rhizophagus diaphanus] [Rhizophagus sp. MUCL 43196]